MKILCTICARGGSKEIKNKNIINFFGRPLIFQTINQAKKSNLFYKIVCSSDSKKILKISQKFGVDLTIKRPKKLSSDKIPKTKAIKHSLEVSEKFFKTKFDLIVDLDVTAPLRSIGDIKKSINKIKIQKKPCNLVTITPSKKNPYFNMVEISKKKILKIIKQDNKITARQMSPKVFDVSAGFYIWNRSGLLANKTVINNKTLFYTTPYLRSIDIDSYTDLEIVKFLYKKKFKDI